MNIFFLHIDPKIAAHNLNYPKLQNKMILEGVQLLATTFNLHNITSQYKTTHANHPSRLWLENDLCNCYWLLEHTKELLDVYTSRSNKIHKCEEIYNWCSLRISLLDVPKKQITVPYLAMGLVPNIRSKYSTEIKHDTFNVWLANNWNEAVLAYREYMQTKEYWKDEYKFID